MARRKRRDSGARPLLLVLVVLLLAGGAWYLLKQRPAIVPQGAQPAVAASIDRVDSRNEGRAITLAGTLQVVHPARDSEIGVSADAVALVREVRMLQWQEHCAGADCSYALAWSARPIDAHAFREPKGHSNATPFPFSNRRFGAGELRLGVFVVDAELAGQHRGGPGIRRVIAQLEAEHRLQRLMVLRAEPHLALGAVEFEALHGGDQRLGIGHALGLLQRRDQGEPGDQTQQAGLADAVGAGDAQKPAGLQAEGEIAE